MKTIEAIDKFLADFATPFNKDLIDRILSLGGCAKLEVQVSPLKEDDPGYERDAYPIRIPKFANSKPEWIDRQLNFPTDVCIKEVGMTGWGWADRVSLACGYDFDTLIGHKKAGVSDEQLERIMQAVKDHPKIEVRRSTRGGGLHLWAYPELIPTENHTIHAHLARVILEKISDDIGFPLGESLDVCGGNMWIWSRRATEANRGFELLSSATEQVSELELPTDWRDRALAAKVKHQVQGADLPHNVCDLDAEHKSHIEALHELGFTTAWNEELGLLQTHTAGFQTLVEDRIIRGAFATISDGSDPGQPNCFAFPRPHGAWEVYRFGLGCEEHESWTQDGQGWTHTTFNAPISIDAIAEQLGLAECDTGFAAPLSLVTKIAKQLGASFKMPDVVDRQVEIKREAKSKKGRFAVKMPCLPDDPQELPGWVAKGIKTKTWNTVLAVAQPKSKTGLVRFVLSEEGKSLGLASRIRDKWVDEGMEAASVTLMAHGIEEPYRYISHAKQDYYTLVNRPFEDEYPEPRLWNRDAAQLAFPIADHDGPCPHFDMLFEHSGADLTKGVQADGWLESYGIHTGADYLWTWAALLFRRPQQLLPMLFFFGPQNCGKSSLHRALAFCMKSGARKIDKVFLRGNTFDAELRGTILGIIEEANLSGRYALKAYDKLKILIEDQTVSIEAKGWDAYDTRNFAHVVQTAQFAQACPITERGDTRIVCAKVAELTQDEIPEPTLKIRWRQEAPFFLRKLQQINLPPPEAAPTRLFLPTINTAAKQEVIEAVAALGQHDDSEQWSVTLAQRLEPFVLALMGTEWCPGNIYTYTALCNGLRSVGAENHIPQDLHGRDNTRVIGQALGKMARVEVQHASHHGSEVKFALRYRKAA